ncbi:glycosyl transferase family 2 [Mobilisporobacter senegalensis]|uniref:Glycosyl transferase family 2 n=1 Tax=Mobilisporobacter senegalensis TaxID=1329262 RepID=A0A3N1XYW0_9FIRM|nr:glycosyltransferase family 2 protein [Mobilisporobacter senegalensis]ROR31478.1 glycosyl transferase family 2 [Mobilisporobacter senegalensis]
MRISVVMATYNGEKYIVEQIDSILNQSVKPDEIVIFDDGSQDGTWHILNLYKKKYPDIIYISQNEKTLGYGKNFWDAIHFATGEFIFLSDQDDIWYQDKIEKMSRVLVNNSGIMSLSTAYELINECGNVYQDIRNVVFKNNGALKRISWKKFMIHPKYPGMAMAIRRTLLDNIPSMLPNNISHDWFLNQYASMNGAMYLWDRILTQYRQHQANAVGSSASNRKIDEKIRRIRIVTEIKDSMEQLLEIFNQEDVSTTIKKFIDKLIYVSKIRIKNIEDERFLILILQDLRFHAYLTKRAILGDIYISFKVMKEKRKKQ